MASFTPQMLLALGAVGIIFFVIVAIITTLLNSLVLWVTTKLFKLKDATFKTALITAFVTWIASFVIGIILGFASGTATSLLFSGLNLILTFLVSVFAVKRFYNLETGKSFLVGLVWLVGQLLVGFIIAMVFAAVILAVIVGSRATGF